MVARDVAAVGAAQSKLHLSVAHIIEFKQLPCQVCIGKLGLVKRTPNLEIWRFGDSDQRLSRALVKLEDQTPEYLLWRSSRPSGLNGGKK